MKDRILAIALAVVGTSSCGSDPELQPTREQCHLVGGELAFFLQQEYPLSCPSVIVERQAVQGAEKDYAVTLAGPDADCGEHLATLRIHGDRPKEATVIGVSGSRIKLEQGSVQRWYPGIGRALETASVCEP